ncbi:aldehyde dehydrogenase family protein [Serratia ureilytica]
MVAHHAARRARIMFIFARCWNSTATSAGRAYRRSTARCTSDALGELTRGMEVVEFARGIPHLIKGENSPGRRQRRRQKPRCSRWAWWRALPRSTSRDGAGGMFPSRHSRQHLHPQARRRWCLRLGAPAELLKEAGLPDGVFNVVHCAEDAGAAGTDLRIQAVSFAASTVAEHIYTTATRTASGCRPRVRKNQAIVMPDADLDATVNALMWAAPAPPASAAWRCRSPWWCR